MVVTLFGICPSFVINSKGSRSKGLGGWSWGGEQCEPQQTGIREEGQYLGRKEADRKDQVQGGLKEGAVGKRSDQEEKQL